MFDLIFLAILFVTAAVIAVFLNRLLPRAPRLLKLLGGSLLVAAIAFIPDVAAEFGRGLGASEIFDLRLIGGYLMTALLALLPMYLFLRTDPWAEPKDDEPK